MAQLAALCGAAAGRPYERHRPEETVLYHTIAAHWGELQERADAAGGLPHFVTREVEEYLRCGLLEHGCVRVGCGRCGFEHLVAFSCKRRGFCPSCLGRRMADTALHLVNKVIPEVPVRQWVCSLPWRLRVLLGYDKRLCAEVLGAFVVEVSRSYKRRAKALLGLGSMGDAMTGAVSVIQRGDSALRLNVHVHLIGLDGVYVRSKPWAWLLRHVFEIDVSTCPRCGGATRWLEAATTPDAIARLLAKHGLGPRPPPPRSAPRGQLRLALPGA